MRFAGTAKQYSTNAINQLKIMTTIRGLLPYFRWPYQANVIKNVGNNEKNNGRKFIEHIGDTTGRFRQKFTIRMV